MLTTMERIGTLQGRPRTREGIGYDEWLRRTDEFAAVTIGRDTSDLPNLPYRDFYDDGASPFEAVERMAQEE